MDEVTSSGKPPIPFTENPEAGAGARLGFEKKSKFDPISRLPGQSKNHALGVARYHVTAGDLDTAGNEVLCP